MADLAKKQCFRKDEHCEHYWMQASDVTLELLPDADGATYRVRATWVDTMYSCGGVNAS